MRTGVIARKEGMTRIFTEDGQQVPVTVLKIDNCQVVGVRSDEKHGYTAVQLGAGDAKVNRTSKAMRGVFAQSKVEPKKKMAGHLGVETVTTQNLKVAGVDLEDNLVLIAGAVPGPDNGWVLITDAVKKPAHKDAPVPAGLKQSAKSAKAAEAKAPEAAAEEAPAEEAKGE